MTRFLAVAVVCTLFACPLPTPEVPDGGGDGGTSADGGIRPSTTELIFGAEAIAALPPARAALFTALQATSRVPVRIAVDRRTKAVMSLTLEAPVAGADGRARAATFVATYQPLLDERVAAPELIIGPDSPCGDAVVVLDRVVGGKAVIGSRLTLHFDGATLRAVTNGVAPVPSTPVTIDPLRAPGAVNLETLLPSAIKTNFVKRQPVLVPAFDGTGLHDGELASWPDPTRSGGYAAAVVVGDIALTPKLTAAGQGAFVRAGLAPRYHLDGVTAQPDYVSFRTGGGEAVGRLPAEINPLESAYRLLEEHPTLLHTGAARCQFMPRAVDEDDAAPGVFFVRLEQRYGRLPVFGSQAVVQLEGRGSVMSLSGRTLPRIEVPFIPTVTVTEAELAFRNHLQAGAAASPRDAAQVAEALAAPAHSRLLVFPRFLSHDLQQKVDRLAYEVTQGSYTGIVDALNKAVLFSVSSRQGANVVRDARGADEFGLLGFATDSINGVPTGEVATPSSDNAPGRAGGTVSSSLASVSAFYATLGWLGQNGNGGDFVANTNVTLAGGACPNAFFDSLLTNNAFFCDGIAASDVVAHELTHGVIAHSSVLMYVDQSGAINEAYADLMGNLIFPDVGGTGWQIGELTTSGAFRDMADPPSRGQPGHMSNYISRGAGCVFPWDCDFGGVHTNSGIINKGHQLLADGFTRAGVTVPGIGRNKLIRLAHVTMTRRLPSSALLNDVAVGTHDVCESFVARGVRDITGTVPFITADCDAVNAAFNEVGLGAGLTTGWTETVLGFEGTDVINSPTDTTPAFCPVLNVAGNLGTLGGAVPLDMDPRTATPASANFGGIYGVDFVVPPTAAGALPLPLATPMMMHSMHWFDVFGYRPNYNTMVIPDTTSCPPLSTTGSNSETFSRDDFLGASGSATAIGPMASAIDARCTLDRTEVELWSNDGQQRLAGPSSSVRSTVQVWFLFIPVNFNQTASLATPPPGGANLRGSVNWSFDLGRSIRVRLRYTFNHPTGVPCTP